MMTKARLFIILITVISIGILFFGNVSCLDFDFSSPKEVEIENPFYVDINSDYKGQADIKVFLHNSSDDKISRKELISLVEFEERWCDSWNYLISAFPDNREYKIKVLSSEGNQNICVKIRPTNSSNIKERCKVIKILPNSKEDKILLKSKSYFYQSEDNLIRVIVLLAYLGVLFIMLFYLFIKIIIQQI